jgi:hypothetical protein
MRFAVFLKIHILWDVRCVVAIVVVEVSLSRRLESSGIERHVSLLSVQTGCKNHLAPVQWVPNVKQAGPEANYLPSFILKVENVWIYVTTPSFVFVAWCFVKHKRRYLTVTYDWHIYYRQTQQTFNNVINKFLKLP